MTLNMPAMKAYLTRKDHRSLATLPGVALALNDQNRPVALGYCDMPRAVRFALSVGVRFMATAMRRRRHSRRRSIWIRPSGRRPRRFGSHLRPEITTRRADAARLAAHLPLLPADGRGERAAVADRAERRWEVNVRLWPLVRHHCRRRFGCKVCQNMLRTGRQRLHCLHQQRRVLVRLRIPASRPPARRRPRRATVVPQLPPPLRQLRATAPRAMAVVKVPTAALRQRRQVRSTLFTRDLPPLRVGPWLRRRQGRVRWEMSPRRLTFATAPLRQRRATVTRVLKAPLRQPRRAVTAWRREDRVTVRRVPSAPTARQRLNTPPFLVRWP